MDKLEQIKKLAEIREYVKRGGYLNPFKAMDQIKFLLSVVDELSDALREIQKINKEVVENAYTTKRGSCDHEGSDL
jgi:hypothetical protein